MTDIEKVQLLIADTSATQFTIAQIQAFLDLNGGSVRFAAASALEAWIVEIARNPSTESIGDYSYGKTALYLMNEQIKRLRADEIETPVIDWAEPDLMGVDEEEDI